jgi:hypothetical protein
MAKKAIAEETIEVAPQPVVAKKTTTKEPVKPSWEIKDRVYILKNDFAPLTFTLKSRNIYYFDEELGYERELKYTTNQKTPFVDEFKGDGRLAHIVFKDGTLFVPREKQVLQKFLSLYHPLRNKVYFEFDAAIEAVEELDVLELQIEALNIANKMDIDQAEAIMRTEVGSEVIKMSSKEIKRDLIVFARNNPNLFLELANDDNINVRNIGIKAVEQNIIRLSNDQRTFTWASNDRKLITVPFDENPYSALAAYFKTDEGIEVYQTVEKRLK